MPSHSIRDPFIERLVKEQDKRMINDAITFAGTSSLSEIAMASARVRKVRRFQKSDRFLLNINVETYPELKAAHVKVRDKSEGREIFWAGSDLHSA